MLKRVSRSDSGKKTRNEDRQKSPLGTMTTMTGARTPAGVRVRPTDSMSAFSDEEQGQRDGDNDEEVREEGGMLEAGKFGTSAPADLLSCPLAEDNGVGAAALLSIPGKP